MPGELSFAEDFELETPVYIYNFVLDKSHILLVNGYECITLGHDLKDEFLQHPFYGTERITNYLMTLTVKNGIRTVTGTDEGGNGDYKTQGITFNSFNKG
jgi:ribonuclease HIII